MIRESSKPVTFGQGEYVVFTPDSKEPLPRETFEKAYEIFNYYSPATIINRNAVDECDKRYDLIREKIKEIDSSLEIVFIPRTLYELVFIKKCIQEDLKFKSVCLCLNPEAHTKTVESFNNNQERFARYKEALSFRLTQKKCWHLAQFTDAGDNNHPGVKDVAYRLNCLITKQFSPKPEGFTCEEVSQFASREIEFLQAHYSNYQKDSGNFKDRVFSKNYPGPTTNFGCDGVEPIKPMGIRNQYDAKIIIDAAVRDCNSHSFILYRGGGKIGKHQPYDIHDDKRPFSLSYGSLFAGCVYDGGATPFYFIRNDRTRLCYPSTI